MKFQFLNQYYQTILLIIEDRPRYEIPILFYKVIIFISYLQIFIYLFTVNESKEIEDLKVEAIAKIIQMTSLKNILSIKDNDTASFIVYLAIQVFVYSYFIYVGVLAFLKHYFENQYEYYKKFFISVNQILNMYFALYIQIFFTQFVELNSSIMFCSKRSLLTDQRISDTLSKDQCSVPIQNTILGVMGLFLTLLTAWIAIHFFRNYEFMEYNLIKRRISYLFSTLMLLKFFLTILYFTEIKNEEYIKHTLSQIIGFVSLLDFFVNRPYSDVRVAQIYLKIISWYYALVNMTHVWLFTDTFMSNELFYFSLLFGLMVETLFYAFNNYQQDCIMLTEVKLGYLPQQLDFYLEEIIKLAIESSKDELAKIKLYKLMKSHMQSCENLICLCKEFDKNLNLQTKGKINIEKNASNNSNISRSVTIGRIKNKIKSQEQNNGQDEKKEGELQFDYVLSIVDSIFKFFLSQHILTKNQVEYEHLSLKYITFMMKYLKNYTRANYELKLLQFQREDFSTYFKVIAKIISSKIQVVISQMNIHLEQRRKDELTVRQLTSVDQITQKFIPTIIKIINEKQKLWGSLQKGYRNMNSFQNESLKLMRQIQITKKQFFQEMNNLKRQEKVNASLQFQKLYLLFYLFVLNDNLVAYDLECIVQDLRKRDSLKDIDSLSNENHLRENIITVAISISQSLGKIVSKKDEKTANFFGYNKQDFSKITKINELMPTYMSRIHDNIVKSFVNSGESQYIKSSKHIFAKDQIGFIMPVKLYLDYSFLTENDFQVSGTLLKVNQAFDYIIFHRTGRVVGITNRISQLLLNNSSQKGHKIPSGEYISNNLQALLLIPKIAKRIFKRKDIIMQNLRSDGDVLIQDRKSFIILRSNPLIQIKKLQSYIVKMNQSQTLQRKVGGPQSFDQFDLFNEKSYEVVNNYKRQEVENSSAAGLSSGRFSGKVSNRSVNTKGSVSRDYQKYKIRFNYTLSFNCISQSYNTEQDLYFQLKMNDLNIVKVKEKQKNSFKLNLVIYLLSTSLINRIDPKYRNGLKGIPLNDASKISQLNEWSFTDEDIPNKLLKLTVQNENQFKAMNDDKQKLDQKNEDDLDDEEKKQKEIQSDSSDDEDESNDLEEEDEEEQIIIEKLRNKKKLLDQYEQNAKFEELNQILQQNQFNESEVLKLDPNFKVKKVMQFKSLSKEFGRAFEKTTVEALLEISKNHKNLHLSSQIDEQNILEIATFRDFRSGPDFKQLQEFQSIKDYSFNVSNSFINTEQNIIKQNSNTPQIIEKQMSIKKTQENEYVKTDISLININTAQDTSILPSFRTTYVNHEINVDISHDNMVSYKNQETNYFGTSARPFFQKQEKHEELNIPDNQTLITPSVDDKSKPTEFTNAATFQNAIAKKEKGKNQQQIIENSSIQLLQNSNVNLSNNQSYKRGSNTQLDQGHSSINKKEKNEFLKTPQSNRQQQLTNDERRQLEGQTAKSDQSQDNDEEVDGQSGKIHEKVVVQILNQKGLIADGSINKGSIHSSTKSSTSYGGNFLKEIIKICKIPKHSYQYLFLLIFFIVVFMCLNITNLMIIQNDMQYFQDNVIVLRQPRKYLRCYAKALFGKILNYEINTGLLEDTNGSIQKTANSYIESALNEYISLVQQFQRVITEYSQLQQDSFDENDKVRNIDVYQFQEKSTQEIDFALTFQNHLFFIIGVQNNQTEKMQIDSYLYLRANFFQFSTDVQMFGTFLVTNVLDTVDNLIIKFTIIAICAIFGVIIVSLISLPIIRLINLYEEKILMIVSRINYDQSQVEKLKLNICQQLIDIDQYDWLKYNYTDITCLRFEQFDANVVNSQYDLQKVSTKKTNDRLNVSNMIKAQQEIMNSNTQRQTSQAKNTPKGKESNQLKRLQQVKKKNYDDGSSSYQDYQISMKNSINKNYVLQSKIINQKLSVFQRFIPLFILTICNTIYFLVIIIYLQESKDLLKIPVTFNKRTILYHIAQSTLKVSSELLTFNSIIESAYFEKIQSNDLDQYQNKMNEMIDLSVECSSQNTDLVYGDNPFPSDVLSKFKDFEEGRICQYLVKNKCNQVEVGSVYSYNFMLTEKIRTIKTYPNVITSEDAPIDKLAQYTNSKDHLIVFINSFLIDDEVLDLYSSSANLSIGTISEQVQSFLISYLQIFGNLFGLTIILVCIYIWKSLYHRIQLMNLLLTFIPEEKLLEEVTLQMLKSLHRM